MVNLKAKGRAVDFTRQDKIQTAVLIMLDGFVKSHSVRRGGASSFPLTLLRTGYTNVMVSLSNHARLA
jgi:hypothetical protein